MMKSWMMVVALAVVSSVASAAKPEGEQVTTLQWQLALDAEGHVVSLVPKGRSIDALRERLESIVRRWEFEPGRIDGRPAASDTLLSVQVTLVPQADGKGYDVKLRDVRTGGALAEGKLVVPKFPSRELSRMARRNAEFTAQVVIEARYDADGKAAEVVAVPGSTEAPSALVEASVKAVRQWNFVPERVGGVGVPGRILLPICFSIMQHPADSSRAQAACGRWTLPGSQASLGEGESLAVDSRIRLKSDPFAAAL